jgi:hypothetical protein
MNSSTNLDWDKIQSTVSDLETYHAVDKELSCLSDLEIYLSDISASHCKFLGELPKSLDPNVADGVAGFYKSTNELYNGLISKLKGVLSYRSIDSDGAVSSGGGSGSYSGGSGSYSGGSSYSSSPAPHVSGTGSPSASTLSQLSSAASSNSPTINSGGVLSRKSGVSSTGGSSAAASVGAIKSTSGTSVLASARNAMSTGGVVSAVGGSLGGTALGAIIGEVGGLGGTGTTSLLSPTNYSMGNYHVGDNFKEKFSDNERQSVTNVLEKYGYSKEEIDTILDGGYDTSNVLIEGVSSSLGEALKDNPGLRDEIINQYGFDVFNSDGSINNDKLSMALYIDDLNGKDNYSMISLLSNNGVNLVDSSSLNNYSNQFESLILKDYGVKDKIINQYGFDIYNTDGTVNKDRLTLAMLIDSKNGDGVTLSSIASETISSDINSYLNTSIKSVKSGSNNKNISGFVPLAAAVAAGGAAAGIGIATQISKNSKKEKNDSERIDNIISLNNGHEDKKNDNDDKNKDWMKKIIND